MTSSFIKYGKLTGWSVYSADYWRVVVATSYSDSWVQWGKTPPREPPKDVPSSSPSYAPYQEPILKTIWIFASGYDEVVCSRLLSSWKELEKLDKTKQNKTILFKVSDSCWNYQDGGGREYSKKREISKISANRLNSFLPKGHLLILSMGKEAENLELGSHREGCCWQNRKTSWGLLKKRMGWETGIDIRPDFFSIYLLKT